MTPSLPRLLAAAALALSSLTASAATLTFGNADVDKLNTQGVRTEAGFQYQATTGAGWELQTVYAQGGAALTTFFNGEGSAVGDRVEFSKVGGGVFSFDSIDYRTIQSSDGDNVTITGFLNNAVVSFIGLGPGTTTFLTAAGFAGAIDMLRIEVSTTGNNAMLFDNLVLGDVRQQPLPIPGSLALVALGLAGLAVAKRRR